MKPKTLDDFYLKGKKILLRVDLNSSVFKGKVVESPRIKAHSKTIKELLRKRAKIIVLAHQGSPGEKNCLSLRQHSEFLNKYANVNFVSETIGKKSWSEISKLKSGEAILLENTRFLRDEFTPLNPRKNSFVNFMKEAGIDCYINDAFSASHRNQTSIVSFPRVFPSGIGRVFEGELRSIQKLKSKLRSKNSLFLLGGKKTKDLISLIKNRRILAGGKLSLLVLISQGYNLGDENKILKKQFDLLPELRKYKNNLVVPVDLAIKINGKRKEFSVEDFPKNYPVLDIGGKTIELYKKEIKKAKAIFFKGSPGLYQTKGFEKGTREILKAISDSKTFSVISGGQSSDALRKFRINKNKFGYVSLSGGALVKYLSGEELPGLEVLKR